MTRLCIPVCVLILIRGKWRGAYYLQGVTIIQKFKALEHGIAGSYNAARHGAAEETFLLRTYIAVVTADMIGRSKANQYYHNTRPVPGLNKHR